MKPGKSGMARLVDATAYSLKGIAAAARNEAAFRQELALVAVLFVASFWLQSSLLEWLVLVVPLFLLLVVELINSAIESIVDRIGSEQHELSGRAKDLGSAAVFISLLMIATVWIAMIWKYFNA